MQRALLYAELIYAQAKTNMDESIGESQEAERLLLLPLQFSQTCDEKLELFIVQNNQDKLIQQFEGIAPAAAVGS